MSIVEHTTVSPTGSSNPLTSPLESLAQAGVILRISDNVSKPTLQVLGHDPNYGVGPEKGVLAVSIDLRRPMTPNIITGFEYRLQEPYFEHPGAEPSGIQRGEADVYVITLSNGQQITFFTKDERLNMFLPHDLVTYNNVALGDYERRRQELNPTP